MYLFLINEELNSGPNFHLKRYSLELSHFPKFIFKLKGSKVTAEKLGFDPSCIAAKGELIAIGNKEGNDCFIYTKSNGTLAKQQELGISEPITAVRFRLVPNFTVKTRARSGFLRYPDLLVVSFLMFLT